MNRLPDELLQRVLDLLPVTALPGAARVCRRWARLLAPQLVSHGHSAPPAATSLRPARALSLCAQLSVSVLAAMAPRLEHLTIHAGAPLSSLELQALRSLPLLRHLDVFASETVVRPTAAPALLSLSTLVLNDAAAPGLLRALQSASRLTALHMFGRALHYPRRELAALLVVRGDMLRALTLRCTELHEGAYEAIGGCRALESLQLYSCWTLTGTAALQMLRAPQLRRLHVTGARLVRARAMSALVAALPPALEELALSATWFGDEHVEVLTAQTPRLRTLEVWRGALTAAGAARLAAGLPELVNLDVDVPYEEELRSVVGTHRALRRVRARGATGMEGCEEGGCVSLEGAGSGRGGLRAAGGGAREGPRAAEFYYWAQGGPPPSCCCALKDLIGLTADPASQCPVS